MWFHKQGGRFDHSNLPQLSRSVVQGDDEGALGVRRVEPGDRAVHESTSLAPRFTWGYDWFFVGAEQDLALAGRAPRPYG